MCPSTCNSGYLPANTSNFLSAQTAQNNFKRKSCGELPGISGQVRTMLSTSTACCVVEKSFLQEDKHTMKSVRTLDETFTFTSNSSWKPTTPLPPQVKHHSKHSEHPVSSFQTVTSAIILNCWRNRGVHLLVVLRINKLPPQTPEVINRSSSHPAACSKSKQDQKMIRAA